MKYLSMSVAALALAAAGGLSAQGNGQGNGQGKERDKPAQAERGNANARGNGNAGRDIGQVERTPDRRNADVSRGNGNSQANRGNGNASANRGNGDASIGRGNGNARNERQSERRIDRQNGRQNERINERINERSSGRIGDRRDYRDRSDDRRTFVRRDAYGLIEGCPPGLAKKNPPCVPPGQARQRDSFFGTSYRPSLFGLSGYGDGRYFYDDGYLMRLDDGGRIGGYIPLLGGALSIGNPWPSTYPSQSVPDYYADYYNLGGADRYRYADNVLYRVDPQTAAIQSIAALLTGDEFVVGQPAPSGYEVYNVPYSYRDRYYDTPEAHYRYSDGYVYRIDPQTQLVAAAIDLLT